MEWFKAKMNPPFGMVQINGHIYVGSDVTISGDKIYLDGVEQKEVVTQRTLHVAVVGDIGTLKTVSGDVQVSGNVGQLSTNSGDVHCSDILGYARTLSGDVSCRDVGGSIKTISGDIIKRK
jgi:hypothetical protein